MPAITIDAFSGLKNIESKGVSIDNSKVLYFGKDPLATWKVFNVYGSIRNVFSLISNILLAEFYICKRIMWADVIIWQWDARIFLPHFWLLKFSNKPILVEWVGSDIRNPDFVFKYNKFYKKEREENTYSYPKESRKRNLKIQRKFKFLNAIPFLCPEMTLYIDKDLFPKYIPTFQRIDVKKYNPVFPSEDSNKIVIVHTPTATGAKGTKYVRSAIAELELAFKIEYIEITNKPHYEALEAIKGSDIFLDQFILGSYGMATCEAMALGKPVFCYLMDPMINVLPSDCPIVNTNPENLVEILAIYLKDAKLRRATGIASRNYVEKYHDANILAKSLINYINLELKKF